VRRFIGLLLLAAAGCSGFAAPRPEQLRELASTNAPHAPAITRYRIHMSLDSPGLAGEFDGVVLAKHGGGAPVIRIQLFGDLGPKMIDLLARPDRVAGYFPQAKEGIDCALPAEAVPHPLIFMGASLVEHFSEWPSSRVLGLREGPDGFWVRLRPMIAGMETQAFRESTGRVTISRHSWMYGLSWQENWPTPDELRVSGSGVSIRVRILERSNEAPARAEMLELKLPADVRLVAGTRK